MKNKFFYVFIIFTCLLFVVSCKSSIFGGMSRDKQKYEIVSNTIIQDNKYIKIKNKDLDKYGYMDFKGKIVIPTNYGKSIYETEGIVQVIQGKKDICYIDPVIKKKHCEINGKKIIGGTLFVDGYCVVKIIGIQGDVIINKNFDIVFGEDNIYRFANIGDGYFLVYENLEHGSNIGIYNANSDEITKTKLNISKSINDEYYLAENDKGYFYFVNKKNMNGILDKEYKYVMPFCCEFSLAVDLDDNIVKIAKNGDIVEKLNLSLFSKDYIKSIIPSTTGSKISLNNVNNKGSLIYNIKDNRIIETKYKYLGSIQGEYVVFREGDYYGIANLNLSEICKAEYDNILLSITDVILVKNDYISYRKVSALKSSQ